MPFVKRYLGLIIVIALVLSGVAGSSTLKDAENEIRHANTYFWLGLSEKGDMESFYRGLNHIKAAEDIVKDLEKTKESDKLLYEINILREDFLNQMEVHFDTLHGVFPIVRMLVPNIFSDALTLGTYELVDDPAVMAATSAGLKLARDVVTKWNAKPQLNVIFNSNTGEKLKDKEPNIALEQEILYIFGSLPKFFVHNSQEVQKYLTKEEYEIFKAGIGFLPSEIINKLYMGFDCNELMIVSVNEIDVINDNYFYLTEGHVYHFNNSKPTQTFFQQGFSRNRNKYFWPIISSFFIGFLISIITFRWIVYKGNRKKIFSLSGKFIIVPMIAYLIGRISPWAIVPMLSKIIPVPETLFFISFWWPCLVGIAIFFIPVLIYLQLNKYLCRIDEDFQITGNGAAILVSISIGVCFYLLAPFLLYWNSFNGFARIICIFLISGYLFYWFGSALDQGEYKVSSNTLLSGIYLLPVLFFFGGAMFFGDTLPLKNYWQSPCQSWAFILLFLSAVLAVCYWKLIDIDKQPVKPLKKIKDLSPVDKFDETNPLPTQKLIYKIQTSKYEYWESRKFTDTIDPIISPLIENQVDCFKTTWLKIAGPAGCGKTAAANAVIKRIEKACDGNINIIAFIGQCRIQTNDEIADTPYEPFRDAFPENLISPLVSSQDIFHKFGDTINPVNMIPSFLGLDSLLSTFDNDSSQVMDEQKQRKLFKMIANYIREKTEKNMVVIFLDNMQEIDSASEKLLTFLLVEFPPNQKLSLLFMIGMRNNDRLLQIVNITPFELDFPDVQELQEMIIYSLCLEEKSAQLISNKFNSQMENKLSAMFQYISMLAESGILIDSGMDKITLMGKYLNTDMPENLKEPESYISMIKDKLKKLNTEQIKVISYAACLGENFNIEFLSGCLKDDGIIETLEKIEKISGIVFDNPEEDGCFSFRDSMTISKVRDIFNITFEGPPWFMVSEKVKKIHGEIAKYFFEKTEREVDYIFDTCIHFYASGGLNAQRTMQCCFVAADVAKKSYDFDLAKNYVEMAINCADYLGIPMNRGEEMLLIDCEKAHIQNTDAFKIADNCIVHFDAHQENISIKMLKVLLRSCYEAVRNIDWLSENEKRKYIEKRKKYREKGKVSIIKLLAKSIDQFAKAEVYFYKAINEDNKDERIDDLKKCLKLIRSIDTGHDDQVQTLASWAEDQLARKLMDHDSSEAIRLFKSSIERKKLLNDRPGLSRSLGGLGYLLIEEGEYIGGRECFQKSLEYAKQINDANGEYQRNYELGDSYLIEIKKVSEEECLEPYQKAQEYFLQGLTIVNQFDESNKNKDKSLSCLFSGLLFCTAKLCLWNDFNKYGKHLMRLNQKGSIFPELSPRIHAAIKIGGDEAGNWAIELKKI